MALAIGQTRSLTANFLRYRNDAKRARLSDLLDERCGARVRSRARWPAWGGAACRRASRGARRGARSVCGGAAPLQLQRPAAGGRPTPPCTPRQRRRRRRRRRRQGDRQAAGRRARRCERRRRRRARRPGHHNHVRAALGRGLGARARRDGAAAGPHCQAAGVSEAAWGEETSGRGGAVGAPGKHLAALAPTPAVATVPPGRRAARQVARQGAARQLRRRRRGRRRGRARRRADARGADHL
jgi:hypothetical protein